MDVVWTTYSELMSSKLIAAMRCTYYTDEYIVDRTFDTIEGIGTSEGRFAGYQVTATGSSRISIIARSRDQQLWSYPLTSTFPSVRSQ